MILTSWYTIVKDVTHQRVVFFRKCLVNLLINDSFEGEIINVRC